MNTTPLEGRTDHSRRRWSAGLAALLVATTVVIGTGLGASAEDTTPPPEPTSDADAACADPEAWAADNGARVVEVDPRWNVAFLVFGGPYAVIGTDDDDFIVGSRRADLICGNGGDDKILSGRGADLIDGGADDDRIWSGRGADIVDGGPGADDVRAGRGSDSCANDAADRFRSCETLIDPPPPPTTTTTTTTTTTLPTTTTSTTTTTTSTTTSTTTTSMVTSTTSTTLPPEPPQARVRVFTQGPAFPSPPNQVLPTIDCIRPRGGQMEAVIGHSTPDDLSRDGRWEVFDFDGNPITYDAVPDFFLPGEQRHTFAVPYDPDAPISLLLSVGQGIYARQAQVFLGAGPDTCAANVPDVIPIYVGGGVLQPTFQAIRNFLTGDPISISVTARQTGTTVCTGAAAFAVSPRVIWGFDQNGAFDPVPAADRIGTVGRFVQTLDPVQQVAAPGSNINVSADLIVDVIPRCQLDGAPDPIEGRVNYVITDTDRFLRVVVDAAGNITASYNELVGGFRRFR